MFLISVLFGTICVMKEQKPGIIQLSKMDRREFFTVLLAGSEAVTGYLFYRDDSIDPTLSRTMSMSGFLSVTGLFVGRYFGIRRASERSLFALVFGHSFGATSLLFPPPSRYSDRFNHN